MIKILMSNKPFILHEWPRENFSLRYQPNIKHRSEENKVKYHWLIQYQILQIYIVRIVCQTVKRITNEFLGVEVLTAEF